MKPPRQAGSGARSEPGAGAESQDKKGAGDFFTEAREIEQSLSSAGLRPLPAAAIGQFQAYLALLLRWNARLNLTSDRTAREILHRHFIPCAFAAQQLPKGISSLLDFGSGAGFPGIPIAICRPGLRVTLAESRGKKAAFLAEAVRVAGIAGATVYAGRVEDLPSQSKFDAVTLRAVDKMAQAVPVACPRAERWLALLTTDADAERYRKLAPEFLWHEPIRLPESTNGILLLGHKARTLQTEPLPGVPRGTFGRDL